MIGNWCVIFAIRFTLDCGLRAHAKCSSSIPANCQPVSRGMKSLLLTMYYIYMQSLLKGRK